LRVVATAKNRKASVGCISPKYIETCTHVNVKGY